MELVKAKPIPLLSAREKMPFEVTPFMPFLTRYQKPGAGISADPRKRTWPRKIRNSNNNNSSSKRNFFPRMFGGWMASNRRFFLRWRRSANVCANGDQIGV